jgi:hypothetical protein
MYSIKNKLPRKNKPSKKKLILIILGALVVIAGLLATLEHTHKIDLVHKKVKEDPAVTHPGPAHSTADSDKGEVPSGNTNTGSSSTDNNTNSNPNSSDNKNENNSTNTDANLIEPSGVFVSNHRPGGNAPNTITSNCTTTPGATCQIIFTKGSVTKSLDAQTTDRGGSAYWTWDVTDPAIGLTSGSWQVQAKATLGSQTKVTKDATALEVK